MCATVRGSWTLYFVISTITILTHTHDLASHTHPVAAVTTTGGSHTHLGSPAIAGTYPQLNQIFGSSAYTETGPGNGMSQNGYGGDHKVQGPTSSDGGTHTVPANTAAASTTNSGNTGTGNSLDNTALSFQQRAMPFLCVNYIIAT